MTDSNRLTQFTHDGLCFDVADTGPIDGTVIVLLHGWPQTAKCWDSVAALLHLQGYRTIAPNQRGYSPHARPRGISAYRVATLTNDIVALIHSLNVGAVHVVGHDWGSVVAWDLAAKHPQLVRTLTSVSVPHSAAFLKSMLCSDQLPRVYYMGLFQLPWLPELIATRFKPVFTQMLKGAGMNAAQIADVYSHVIEAGAFTGSLNYYRAMPFTSPRDLMRKVSVPTMHIWGGADSALSRKSAELTKNQVTGPYRLVVLEHANHWIPEQNPNELAKLIIESISVTA